MSSRHSFMRLSSMSLGGNRQDLPGGVAARRARCARLERFSTSCSSIRISPRPASAPVNGLVKASRHVGSRIRFRGSSSVSTCRREALRFDPSKGSRSIALLRLPEDVQGKIEGGELPARSASEIARLRDEYSQRELAQQAAEGKLTRDQTAKAVRQRKVKAVAHSRGTHRTFVSGAGWKVTVSSSSKGSHYDIRNALQQAIEEVDHCIANNVQML